MTGLSLCSKVHVLFYENCFKQNNKTFAFIIHAPNK